MGNIEAVNGETLVAITMRPLKFTLIFISIWLFIFGFICVLELAIAFTLLRQITVARLHPILLMPFVMFLFGYLLTMIAFKTESGKSKKFLASLLEAGELE